MTRDRFRVVRIDEVESQPGFGGTRWIPLRRELDVQAFGVNAYTADEAGQRVIEEHDETGGGAGEHEELYVVLTGRARFTLDGEDFDAPAGTAVFLADPGVRRGAVSEEAGTTVLAVGGRRGEPYRVSPWELYGAAIPYDRAGDFEQAAAITARGLEIYPGHPSILYNLACFEAKAGRRDDALAHLREALDGDSKLRQFADEDPDFDSIREDPAFPR